MTPKQAPLPSGFGPATTTDDVMRGVDLRGKVALVTGGYSGLGLESVRVLAAAGAEVVVPARDVERARRALGAFSNVRVEAMDLQDPRSIDAFAERFLAQYAALSILLNSAGIMAGPLVRDARGFEAQLATNHFGHFQLTLRLLPALRRAGAARVVSVSSKGHWFSPFVFEDPHFERRAYDEWQAYGQSKTANVLFAVELDRREQAAGVRAFALHPGGIVGTGLSKHISLQALRDSHYIDESGAPIIDPTTDRKTVAQGAATQVWCAVSPQLAGLGGLYCADVDVESVTQQGAGLSLGAAAGLKGVRPYAIDPEAAQRLWTYSLEALGLSDRS